MTTGIHWSGLGLIAGAVALGVATLLIATRPVVAQVMTPTTATLLVVAGALLVSSLPAMYAVQAERSGVWGLVAHALLVVGLLLLVVVAAPTILHPTLELATIEHPLVFGLGIALTLGLVLTGVATLQAGVFPRGAALLLLGAMAGFFFVFFVAEFLPPIAGQIGLVAFGILLSAGFGWIGLELWRTPSTLSGVTPA